LDPLKYLGRDLKILFWSTFLWTFGVGVYSYVWPIFLESLDANPTNVGVFYSIGYIAMAASMIPGAILANKYRLKPLLVLGWIVCIPVPLIYYFAHTWTDTIPGIILLDASGFNLPAFNAYISAIAQRKTAGSNFGILYASAPLGIAVGPLLGALILTFASIRQTFLVTLMLFIVSSIVVLFIKPVSSVRLPTQRIWSLDFPKTWIGITLLLFLCISGIAYSSSLYFFPLYFSKVLSLSPVTIQILGSAQQFGAAIFAIMLGRRADIRGRGPSMTLGLLLSSSGIIGILLSGNFLLAIPMIFLFGAARGPSIVGYSILSSLGSKTASKSGQYGLYLTLEYAGLVVGSYLGGLLFTANSTYGFIASIVLFLGLAMVVATVGFEEPDLAKVEEEAPTIVSFQ
jgi:MFS family permease